MSSWSKSAGVTATMRRTVSAPAIAASRMWCVHVTKSLQRIAGRVVLDSSADFWVMARTSVKSRMEHKWSVFFHEYIYFCDWHDIKKHK